MSNGAGIQELMAAETRASQIVAEARIGKEFLSIKYIYVIGWIRGTYINTSDHCM